MINYKDFSSTDKKNFDTNVDVIKNSLKNILYTRKGSFPGNPLFGSDLYEDLFELNDTLTEIIIKTKIEIAISNWEKRVNIENISIKRIPEYNKIIINILFTLKDDELKKTETLLLSI